MKKWIAMTLVLALALLAGCAADSKAESRNDADYVGEAGPVELKEEAETLTAAGMSLEQVQLEDQKLIRTVYADVETKDLDTLLAAIDSQVGELGGYVQSREIYNGSAYGARRSRNANMTVRIPAEKLGRFMGQVQVVSNVVSYNESIDDVTMAYVDTESRMKALETEQARLLELLEKAENMADLLGIESRLTEVRYELERVGSQLRVYDNKVSYATVHLSVSQVEELTAVEEPTFWEKVSSGFRDSLKNLGRFLSGLAAAIMAGSPYLIFLALLALAAVLIWRAANAKKKKPTEPPQPPEQPK